MKLTRWIFAGVFLASALVAVHTVRVGRSNDATVSSGDRSWHDCRLLLLEGRGWEEVESYYGSSRPQGNPSIQGALTALAIGIAILQTRSMILIMLKTK